MVILSPWSGVISFGMLFAVLVVVFEGSNDLMGDDLDSVVKMVEEGEDDGLGGTI